MPSTACFKRRSISAVSVCMSVRRQLSKALTFRTFGISSSSSSSSSTNFIATQVLKQTTSGPLYVTYYTTAVMSMVLWPIVCIAVWSAEQFRFQCTPWMPPATSATWSPAAALSKSLDGGHGWSFYIKVIGSRSRSHEQNCPKSNSRNVKLWSAITAVLYDTEPRSLRAVWAFWQWRIEWCDRHLCHVIASEHAYNSMHALRVVGLRLEGNFALGSALEIFLYCIFKLFILKARRKSRLISAKITANFKKLRNSLHQFTFMMRWKTTHWQALYTGSKIK